MVVSMLMMMTFVSCAGPKPENLGVKEGRLAPCPSSPNCVCSDDGGSRCGIAAIELVISPKQAWPIVVEVVYEMDRTTVIRDDEGYLHAEVASAIFGYVDDLELQLRAKQHEIAVRSASRMGWSDMGVNRRRVESIRKKLVERGVAR